jgi:large subunit ribosomal protein L10
LNRSEKETEVGELHDKFSKAQIAVVTDYRGLTVQVLQELRRELKKSSAEIRVAKNTLLRRAVQGTSYESMAEFFQGTTAIAVSDEEPVAAAKALVDFAKTNPKLEIRGGVLDGKMVSLEELTALAKLPSREVLLAQLLSCMQSVPTNFVSVLAGVPRKMVYLLQAVKDAKEQTVN